jgi:hypothetical protein
MLHPELVVMTRTSALRSKLLLASQTFAVHKPDTFVRALRVSLEPDRSGASATQSKPVAHSRALIAVQMRCVHYRLIRQLIVIRALAGAVLPADQVEIAVRSSVLHSR